jgi:hypothetical protein
MAVEGVINLSESDRDSENNKQIFPRLRQPIFGSQLFDSPIICCSQPGTWPRTPKASFVPADKIPFQPHH